MVDTEKGVWRTISGRRVFIKDGQSVAAAMQASGKFSANRKKAIHLEPAEYKKVMSEINTNYHARFAGEQTGHIAISHDFGAYLYQFEINDYNQYRFISKTEL